MLTGVPLTTVSLSPVYAQSAPSAAAKSADPVAAFIAEAAHRFDMPAPLIRAVIRAESGGDARAVSPAGAMGLMQIMPNTWAELRIRHGLGIDPFDPRDNILAGAAYLREMRERFGAPGFLAAYNAGPDRYEEHLTTGRALPAETQDYVAALAPLVGGNQADGAVATIANPQAWARAPLFVVQAQTAPAAYRTTPGVQSELTSTHHFVVDLSAIAPQSDGLFVQRFGAEATQ
ncbi:lytic transglycosylase domain-containing protein [Blastochloris sulfoviridis]|uniref:Lytic transglycosylase domain-containing protein n=2 Tax=Blastochloris sulfoviridis TaxID=50712 RepID=A0A5M6I0W9_9HYPH|nr:lytic transglycosylase domain-containing protein [Blastochloris sulfoviridis]